MKRCFLALCALLLGCYLISCNKEQNLSTSKSSNELDVEKISDNRQSENEVGTSTLATEELYVYKNSDRGDETLSGKTYYIHPWDITFENDDTFSIDYGKEYGLVKYTYKLDTKNGTPFITVTSPTNKNNNPYFFDFIDKSYIFLYNATEIHLYDSKNKCYITSQYTPSTVEEYTPLTLAKIGIIENTSNNEVIYKDINENTFTLNEYWLLPNNGKNASLVFDPDPESQTSYISKKNKVELQKLISSYLDPIQDENDKKTLQTHYEYLIWVSGNLDYNAPELYLEYARPKRILITVENSRTKTKTEYHFDLEDTPNPQILKYDGMLLFTHANKKVTITIEDVYPGTKYKDVCINKLDFYFGKRPN